MPKYVNVLFKKIQSGRFSTIPFSDIKQQSKKALNQEHKMMLLISFITGLRPIEASRIKREDIDFPPKYIRLKLYTAKKGANRTILIPNCDELTQEFKKMVLTKAFPKEYIFPTYSRKKNIREKFIHDNYRTGIGYIDPDTNLFYPHSFYIFRHNILTLLAEHGADFIDLHIFKGARLSQQLFGSVSYYIHHSVDRMKKIAKILRKIMKNEI